MSLKKIGLAIYFCCSFILCQGGIFEIKNMNELYKYLKPEAFIIFDIDNTLMEPAQELGNDQWFRYQIKKYEENGLSKEAALRKTVAEWHAIQNITQMLLAENGSEKIIHHLQSHDYPIIGLTTRSLDISSRTIEQLKILDIELSKTAPTKNEIFFMNGSPVLFRNGILFTANTNKGDALEKFLNAISYNPKLIIFVNDKESHIFPVEQYCTREKIPFIGLRYSYLDHRVKNFRPEIAEIQYSQFGRIVTNEFAEKILLKDK